MSFTTTEEPASPMRFVIAALCALLAVGGIAYGYMKLRTRQAQQNAIAAKAVPTPPPPAQAKVFEDEPLLRGRQALIGGTVQNISAAALPDVVVEIELIPRKSDKPKEIRAIKLAPQNLNATHQGAYTLFVPSGDYAMVHVVAVKSGAQLVCQPKLQKCTAPGKQRPLETTPDAPDVIKRTAPALPAKPRSHNPNEVINTPETADRY